jgi:hypothetical protein
MERGAEDQKGFGLRIIVLPISGRSNYASVASRRVVWPDGEFIEPGQTTVLRAIQASALGRSFSSADED